MAERAGFEPARPVAQPTRSPGAPIRPLWHLSKLGKILRCQGKASAIKYEGMGNLVSTGRVARLDFRCCGVDVMKDAILLKGNGMDGGEGGIRTRDTRKRIPLFESGAFVHSATSPGRGSLMLSFDYI